MRLRNALIPFAVAALLIGCASEPMLEASTLPQTPQVHRLGDVYTAGQPTANGLEGARDEGIRSVINLRKEVELPFDEARLVEELGMTYYSLPWNGPDELTDEVFRSARTLLTEASGPTLLHCASANRVGAVWIPWRVLDGGISLEKAVEEARAIGMRSPDYERLAREYVVRAERSL